GSIPRGITPYFYEKATLTELLFLLKIGVIATSKVPSHFAWESNRRSDVSLRTREACPAALSTFMNEVK
ncbi:hypothetical protein KC723_03015, partial [Candidatus Kaiserbacteria bacterium]|nr:hypothetical protein [Candidatus Kaiserbacteria bacterium]